MIHGNVDNMDIRAMATKSPHLCLQKPIYPLPVGLVDIPMSLPGGRTRTFSFCMALSIAESKGGVTN
jgi:hypothetical protein